MGASSRGWDPLNSTRQSRLEELFAGAKVPLSPTRELSISSRLVTPSMRIRKLRTKNDEPPETSRAAFPALMLLSV